MFLIILKGLILTWFNILLKLVVLMFFIEGKLYSSSLTSVLLHDADFNKMLSDAIEI